MKNVFLNLVPLIVLSHSEKIKRGTEYPENVRSEERIRLRSSGIGYFPAFWFLRNLTDVVLVHVFGYRTIPKVRR